MSSVIPDPVQTDWVPLWTLGNPSVPCARVYNNVNQSCANGAATVAFNSERYDTDGIHDTATNNSRLTCRTAGKYLIWFHGDLANSGAGTIRQTRIVLNGSAIIAAYNDAPATNMNYAANAVTVADLAVGDYVEAVIYQDSGGALTLSFVAQWTPEFGMCMVAPPAGSPFGSGPKVTTGPISSGPPASPADGDIWNATNVGSAGERWQFQYNASSASAYKWEFIGGSDLYSNVLTGENSTTVSTWLDLATPGPLVTIPRAGDYDVVWAHCYFTHGTASASGYLGVSIGATNPPYYSNPVSQPTANYSSGALVAPPMRFSSLTAGSDLRLRYNSPSTGTSSWANRVIRVRPVRVS